MKMKEIRADGYKNLIDARVPLGDFNVLVGPNNSGKTNLLEVFELLWMTSFGSEDVRGPVFEGCGLRKLGSSVPHLVAYRERPLRIGVGFEVPAEGKTWRVDYDAVVQRSREEKHPGRFSTETLRAKEPSRTGPPRQYFARRDDVLKVLGKRHRIEGRTPSLEAIKTLYPESQGLPPEFPAFTEGVLTASLTSVISLSPGRLRDRCGDQDSSASVLSPSFDVVEAISEIHEDEEDFRLFRETACDVLDLEDLLFKGVDRPFPAQTSEAKDAGQIKFCFLKSKGKPPATLWEYSDGTILVIAILAVLFRVHPAFPLVCIEEPENCLHPAALEKLLRFLQDNAHRWPVLLTTHSPYLVNGVKPEDVIVSSIDETGAARFRRGLDRKAVARLLKSGYMSFGDLLVTNFEEVLGGK